MRGSDETDAVGQKCGRGLLAATLNIDAHSKELRLNRITDLPATFFVTKSLQPKKPLLDAQMRNKIVSALAHGVLHKRIYLAAFVVMPDHWHALLCPHEPWTLPKYMHAMMTFVARKSGLEKSGAAWQDGYYETRIRTAKQFGYVRSYIEQNPVKKGLVEQTIEWRDSSAAQADLLTNPWPFIYD